MAMSACVQIIVVRSGLARAGYDVVGCPNLYNDLHYGEHGQQIAYPNSIVAPLCMLDVWLG